MKETEIISKREEIIWGELYSEWLKPLKGQIIVDLGAGANNQGYILARLVGAHSYIGVEGFAARDLLEKLEREHRTVTERPGLPLSLQFKNRPHIPTSVMAEGMCEALERFPDDCISIFALQ